MLNDRTIAIVSGAYNGFRVIERYLGCFSQNAFGLCIQLGLCNRTSKVLARQMKAERALPASQKIGNLGTWEVSRGAL